MKNLVLDLDETLVFSSLTPKQDVDLDLEIAGQRCFVQIRPGIERLMRVVRPLFDCRIWSTGQPVYVEAVCKELDLDWMVLWGRDRCRRLDEIPANHHEPYDKPLDRVGSLEETIIVDNAPGTFACNPQNGIPITTWRGDPDDRQLHALADYLSWLARQPDVRRDHWRWASEVVLMRNASRGSQAVHG